MLSCGLFSQVTNTEWLYREFNGRFRDECLNERWFSDIVHARKIIIAWRQYYNEYRPHSSLNYQTSSEIKAG
jgi:putative transposase